MKVNETNLASDIREWQGLEATKECYFFKMWAQCCWVPQFFKRKKKLYVKSSDIRIVQGPENITQDSGHGPAVYNPRGQCMVGVGEK